MPRTRRPEAWFIAEQKDETFDVMHGRRQVTTGLQSIASAKAIVGQHRRPMERVWVVATDGYRTEITKSFPEMADTREPAAVPEFDPARPARSRYLARYGRSAQRKKTT